MSGSGGGPSDEKDAEIRRLKDELAKAKAQGAQASLTGSAASKARRKEREALAERVFGKWRRR